MRIIRIDPFLLLAIAILASVGLFILYSAAGHDILYVKKQLINYAVAVTLMFAVAQLRPEQIQLIGFLLFILGLILLILVVFFGSEHKGAKRWLDLGFITFQPAEIMRLALPMMIAFYLSKMMMPIKYMHFFLALLMVTGVSWLIFQQPDLGTAVLIASSGIMVIFFAGLTWRVIVPLLVLTVSAIPLAWKFLLKDYQKQRVLTMFDPESDRLGSGYHIIQSKITIGSGGVYGKGWLEGTQTRFDFLPESHTDFIFAVLAEEFGLLGVLLLFFLYLLIVARIMWIAYKAPDVYSRLIAASIGVTFFLYFFINVGMVSGILPVVGLPLPLVSYGGSSLVTIFIGFGILMAIYTHREQT